MIFPADAAEYVGKIALVKWQVKPEFGDAGHTFSGGRILRVDETYLYIQPIGESPQKPLRDNESPTRLGLKVEEQRIALIDIDEIRDDVFGRTTFDE
jgi:hypothetical protein